MAITTQLHALLSTEHVDAATAELLDRGACPNVCSDRVTYGWRVFVPEPGTEDSDVDPIPQCLLDCFDAARAVDAEYIIFDCDAPADSDLPIYEGN